MHKTSSASRGSPAVDPATGWLRGARQVPSPHCDDRPDTRDISLLVIHNISLPPGQFGSAHVEQLFLGTLDCDEHPYFDRLRGVRVSAHFFINRRGQLTQFVPLHRRAWHAGVSVFEGRERCNDFSIGIELEGTDERPFTVAQYRQLVRVTKHVRAAYPRITQKRITGHSDIAPGRKTDPGPHFDWARYRRESAT